MKKMSREKEKKLQRIISWFAETKIYYNDRFFPIEKVSNLLNIHSKLSLFKSFKGGSCPTKSGKNFPFLYCGVRIAFSFHNLR